MDETLSLFELLRETVRLEEEFSCTYETRGFYFACPICEDEPDHDPRYAAEAAEVFTGGEEGDFAWCRWCLRDREVHDQNGEVDLSPNSPLGRYMKELRFDLERENQIPLVKLPEGRQRLPGEPRTIDVAESPGTVRHKVVFALNELGVVDVCGGRLCRKGSAPLGVGEVSALICRSVRLVRVVTRSTGRGREQIEEPVAYVPDWLRRSVLEGPWVGVPEREVRTPVPVVVAREESGDGVPLATDERASALLALLAEVGSGRGISAQELVAKHAERVRSVMGTVCSARELGVALSAAGAARRLSGGKLRWLPPQVDALPRSA